MATPSIYDSRSSSSVRLTRREAEVLELAMRGGRNKELAATLFVTKKTVDYHLQSVYKKLGVKRRMAAIQKAMELNLIRFNNEQN
jgi:ATP/maltotriose-dependent transcriptional regulator MalT